ncbi:hypothetical protein SAMN02745133_01036 [Desulforamulus putei DSM 12395]|uniref:Regulatory protein, FmdB family n=1 Tax=Desulforamulus putei DSM 12395 TaxID=1121429 RepID=A0A1M4VY18_9FIRM|nr:hypothetical protein SAMN02745133_01036 [Desulforamulus putei DSM 12395]
MVRYKCEQCGKIVEYLKSFGKGPKSSACSCGGQLKPIDNLSEQSKGGEPYENRHPGKERPSE